MGVRRHLSNLNFKFKTKKNIVIIHLCDDNFDTILIFNNL